MSWVAVAIGGATLINGMLSSNAANNAASAQTNAANLSNQTQMNMFNQQRADSAPWRNAGAGSVNYLSYLLGIPGYQNFWQGTAGGGQAAGGPANLGFGSQAQGGGGISPNILADRISTYRDHGYGGPEGRVPRPHNMNTGGLDSVGGPGTGMVPTGGAPGIGPMGGAPGGFQPQGAFGSLMTPFGMSQFQADPGYAFRIAEGQKALERSAAAKGGLFSGATGKALSRYGQDMASQEYGNAYNRYNNDQSQQFNRLAALAGIGQTSQGQINQLGMNAANQVGQNYLGMGNAQAANAVAQGNAWGNTINGLGNAWMMYGGYGRTPSNLGGLGASGIGSVGGYIGGGL